MPPVRAAGVDYLNTEPLVWGLGGKALSLRRMAPSLCARALEEGQADVALIPAMAYREDWRVVPGVSISCDGPAVSVLLAGRKPATDMRRVALDPASRTAAALLQILFREHWKTQPRFEAAAPADAAADESFDGFLVIGDAALHLPLAEKEADELTLPGPRRSAFSHVYDLGEEWKTLTGLPFVFAFWAGVESLPVRAVSMLRQAKAESLPHLREIAEAYARTHRRGVDFYENYLRNAMRYGFGKREMEALTAFYGAAVSAGLLSRIPVLKFYEG